MNINPNEFQLILLSGQTNNSDSICVNVTNIEYHGYAKLLGDAFWY